MLVCASCCGVVGNICSFTLFKQAGAWVNSKTTSGKNMSLAQSPKYPVAFITPGVTHSRVFSLNHTRRKDELYKGKNTSLAQSPK